MSDRPKRGRELKTLADYAARVWLAEQNLLEPLATFDDLLEVRLKQRQYRASYARAIRGAVLARHFSRVFDALGSFGGLRFRVLERAFPLMSKNERARWLQYVWCRAKIGCPASRAHRLFEAVAPHQLFAVPSDWPAIVTLYRGSWGWTWRQAQQRIRRGLSWTIDRNVAITFAARAPHAGYENGVWSRRPHGCLGIARVTRREILAHIKDDDYDERECIIRPAAILRASYECVDLAAQWAEEEERKAIEKGGA